MTKPNTLLDLLLHLGIPAADAQAAVEAMQTGKLLPIKVDECVQLPDGSGFATVSMPLPQDHWIYESNTSPPIGMRIGTGEKRNQLAEQIRAAAKYAVRGATMSGKAMDFDPDALVQNMVVGLLGYWTENGLDNDDPHFNPPHTRN